MPRVSKRRPKFVLMGLGRKANYPYAIVDWHRKEVHTYVKDRNEGLDLVRQLQLVDTASMSDPSKAWDPLPEHMLRQEAHGQPEPESE